MSDAARRVIGSMECPNCGAVSSPRGNAPFTRLYDLPAHPLDGKEPEDLGTEEEITQGRTPSGFTGTTVEELRDFRRERMRDAYKSAISDKVSQAEQMAESKRTAGNSARIERDDDTGILRIRVEPREAVTTTTETGEKLACPNCSTDLIEMGD